MQEHPPPPPPFPHGEHGTPHPSPHGPVSVPAPQGLVPTYEHSPGLNHTPKGPRGESESPDAPPIIPEQLEPRRKRQRQEPTSRADVVYLRKRATAACRLCRSRKVKCNNAKPTCGNCAAHEAVCVYDDSLDNISTFDPASIAILDKLTRVMSRLDQLPDDLANHLTTHVTPSPGPPQSILKHHHHALEPAARHLAPAPTRVELRIPAAPNVPEAILRWPVLADGATFPSSYITDAVFEAEVADDDSDDGGSSSSGPAYTKAGAAIFDESEVMPLVQTFFDHVHIKNPILEPETLWTHAKRVAEEGPKWDAPSCLVLIVCALGSVARKFPDQRDMEDSRSTTSLVAHASALRRGEGYFNLARRRLGLLQRGLLSMQCRFLAGVYLMYTMRPLQAWSEFHSASRSYHIYLQCQARKIDKNPSEALPSHKRRRLEQRLYWSCYKSECELRAEMDLPNSSLASFDYPDMHPSPPDMGAPTPDRAPTHTTSIGGPSALGRHPGSSDSLHEETWYYYLMEITLRRLYNDIINQFYANGHDGWNNETVVFMAKTVRDFEQQLDMCYEALPSILHFEDHMIPSREIPFMVRGRMLEIQCCMYLPFLYYVIHNPAGPYRDMVQPLAEKALQRQLCIIEVEPMPHRHHGSWYGLRSAITAALCVLAAARSGAVRMPDETDWKEILIGSLDRMRYWAEEAPGAGRSIEVLRSFMQ